MARADPASLPQPTAAAKSKLEMNVKAEYLTNWNSSADKVLLYNQFATAE